MITVNFLGQNITFNSKEELKKELNSAIKMYQKQKIFNNELAQLKMLKMQYGV